MRTPLLLSAWLLALLLAANLVAEVATTSATLSNICREAN